MTAAKEGENGFKGGLRFSWSEAHAQRQSKRHLRQRGSEAAGRASGTLEGFRCS